jgi:hypothetical protein
MKQRREITGMLAAIALVATPAWAQDAAPVEGTEEATTVGTSSQTEGSLSAEFAEFLGSEEQAATVVDGLRQGTAFTVGGEVPEGGGEPVDGTTIEPPTGTMGYGNVRISLKLAESNLAEMGITQPTGEQLQAALLGGEIDGQAVDGVLAMRADGMGWGQIAHEYGVTVGQMMGKAPMATSTSDTSTTTATTATGNGYIPSHPQGGAPGQAKAAGNGYIPSHPKGGAPGQAKVTDNGYIPSGSSRGGAGVGVVTGSGASVASTSNGKSLGHDKAGTHSQAPNKQGYIPTGSSGAPAAVTTSAAGGAGQGLAKGHVNKK